MPVHNGGLFTVRVDGISKNKLLPPEALVHQEAGFGLGLRDKIRTVGSRFGGRTFGVNYAVVRRSLL